MSSVYITSKCIIPSIRQNDANVRCFLQFLQGNEVPHEVDENGDVSFLVHESEYGDCYTVDDAPDNELMHGCLTPGRIRPLLCKLVDENKVCLVLESYWDSGWSPEDFDDSSPDYVGMAEQIPTLILQEVLAKRLKGEHVVDDGANDTGLATEPGVEVVQRHLNQTAACSFRPMQSYRLSINRGTWSGTV